MKWWIYDMISWHWIMSWIFMYTSLVKPMHLSEFLYLFLKKRLVPWQSWWFRQPFGDGYLITIDIISSSRFGIHGLIVEWGYSMLFALQRYSWDADCELFLKVCITIPCHAMFLSYRVWMSFIHHCMPTCEW